MKISQRWLKNYVDFKLTPEQLTDDLTMLGLEVEGHEDQAKKFENFVVGEVLERQKHPNADRLSLCKVNIGAAVQEIVCGAPNVAAGQKVAVALVGAVIPHDQHDPEGKPFVLARAKIRGVESNGMICSARELGLGEDADGIIVLEANAKSGTPLAQHLHHTDVVFDIGITPNRGDCLSHIGIGREVSLISKKPVKLPSIKIKESKTLAKSFAKVVIADKERCPRYVARVVRNVKMRSSPEWLQEYLKAVEIRPINVVVDVTNFVMMESGQPLHAFDYDKLAQHTIVVKTAVEGEHIVTLDGKGRTLTSDMLMICDGEKPVAIAGVMGGRNSEIGDATTNILIESAYFSPSNIRRTAKALGLSTEASYRFERGVDIGNVARAADRAAQLIQEFTDAEVLKGAIDVYPRKWKPTSIKLRTARTNEILGTELTSTEVSANLKRIGCAVRQAGKGTFAVSPPSYRTDIDQEIDLIEEIARVHGYENIETKTKTGIDFSSSLITDRFQDELRTYLIGSGYNEILALSLQEEKIASLTGEQIVRVLNPVSTDMQALRPSLVPGMLESIQRNRNFGSKDLQLFEIGSVFSLKGGLSADSLEAYVEEERVLIAVSGNARPLRFGSSQQKHNLLGMKGAAEALLSKFCLDKYRLIPYDTRGALTDFTMGIEISGTYAGYLGRVKKEIVNVFAVDEDVFVCELVIPALEHGWVRDRKFSRLPKFPAVTRDLAFVVDQELPQATVEDVIRESGRPLLTNVVLFDMYVGEQAGEGKKSLAYALEFQSAERTLTDEEIERTINRIVKEAEERCKAALRRS